MTREDAITVIVTDVAEHGKATRTGLRAYVETPTVSHATFMEACRQGMTIFERREFVELVPEYLEPSASD